MGDARAARAPDAGSGLRIENVSVSTFTVPTNGPGGVECDGTLCWKATTMILVELAAAGVTGLGYTYGDAAAGHLIAGTLKREVEGKDPFLTGELWHAQMVQLRNTGVPGIGSLALSAVDIALWDLKARLLGVPLFRLLGAFRERVPVYGSGGFCNLPLEQLAAQVSGWVGQGIPRVKIKTSRQPEQDAERLAACRAAVGPRTQLMTDANGALTRKEALRWAHRFRDEWDVVWFEEPVSSDDVEGLRLVRDQGPPGLDIAAGEYGFTKGNFLDLIQGGAVDCMQADVTRCGGITGLMEVAGLCAAHSIDLSAHCAPAVSAHAFCGVEHLRHLEYFHDHERLERMLFDGALEPREGVLVPDASRPGLGLELKRKDAERFLVWRAEA